MIMSHSSACYGIILIIIFVLFCEPIGLSVISVFIMPVLLKYFSSVRSNKFKLKSLLKFIIQCNCLHYFIISETGFV